MKKLGISLLVIVALVIVALLVLPMFIDVNRYHDRIQAELSQRLGRPVSLGQMHLSLLPPSFRAESPVIGADPNFHNPLPFAQADELNVSVALWPLLHSDVQVNSLELRRPKIELIRNAEGKWNFSTLGENPAQPAPAQSSQQRQSARAPKPSPAPGQQPAASGQKISLDDLRITDGQVAITDFEKRQPRAVYDHIDLHVAGYAPDKAFDLEAAAHLPGEGKEVLQLNGKAGPVDVASPADTPFDGDLEAQQLSLSGLQHFLNVPALAGNDASFTGKAHLKNGANSFSSDGAIDLQQVRLRSNDLGYPILLDYSVANQGGALEIKKGNIKLGTTPIEITGAMNLQPTPAQMDVKLRASDVSIQELARLAAAEGVAFNPGMNIAGHFSADLSAKGTTASPVLNGNLQASNLEISGKDLPQPVRVNSIQLALAPNEVRSNPFSASTGGTSLNLQFALSQYATPSPLINADVSTTNANVGELLSIAKAYGVSAAEGVNGSGTLNLQMHAAGPLKNSAAMTFSGSGALQNAQLQSPAITQPFKVGNANIRFSQNSVILENVAAALGSTNAKGSLTLHDFNNPQLQFALSADKLNADEMEKIFSGASAKTAALQLVPRATAASPQPSFLSKAAGAGTLSVGTLSYTNLVLNNVQSKVALDHGLIRLDPLTALLYGGQETGNIVVDTRATPVRYAINTKLAKVDANQLLSSVSSLKQTLYGLLGANLNSTFNSGATDIARTLNGNVNLDLSNGKLANVDLLYQLANVGKFLNTGKTISQHPFTNLVRLTGGFNIQNGVAQTNNLQAIIDGGTLAGNGLINLAENSMNMHVTAVLNKAMTNSVGGTNIGGYMQTALANQNGELVIPVLVSGPLSNPRFAPDVEAVAKMKLQNILPTAANPGALSGLLGNLLGTGTKSGAQAPPPNGTQTGNSQQKPWQGILQGLGGNRGPGQQPSGGMPQTDKNAPQQQQAQPQQQKPQNLGDMLNGILNKQKKQQQPPPPPPPQ